MKRIEDLSAILSKGQLDLIDEFENEFFKFIPTKELFNIIGYKNRVLLRNAYKAIILLYGKEATLYHLYDILVNFKDDGRKQIVKLSRRTFNVPFINKLKEDVTEYFLNTYYNQSKTHFEEYSNCINTRYMIQTMIDKIEFQSEENKDLSFKIITENK